MEWNYLALGNRDSLAGTPISRSLSRSPAWWLDRTLVRSAPTRPTRMQPSCGGNSDERRRPAHVTRGLCYRSAINDMAARGVIPAETGCQAAAGRGSCARGLPDRRGVDRLQGPTSPRTGDRSCTANRVAEGTAITLVAAAITPTESTNGDAPLARPTADGFLWTWLCVAPFFLLQSCSFPAVHSSSSAVLRSSRRFTFQNIIDIFTKSDIRSALPDVEGQRP